MAYPITYRDETLSFHHTYDESADPGSFQTHFHERYEILCVFAGSGSFLVEGSAYPVAPGMIFLTRPGESHKMQIARGCVYDRVAVHFSEAVVKAVDPDGLLLQVFSDRNLGQGNSYSEAVLGGSVSAVRSLPEYDRKEEQRLFLYARLFYLLCDLRTAFLERQQRAVSGTVPGYEVGSGAVSGAVEYINEHLFSDISLTDVAAHVFLSPSQLTRLFRELIGTPVYEYITRKRLIAAKAKIDSGMRATEVAAECGFGNYSSFFKAYKKRFGVSPTGVQQSAGKKEIG